ncbi:COG5456 Predicted integral membrane protein linked to a cation pump [Rhabdaerophilaceae bacterium]
MPVNLPERSPLPAGGFPAPSFVLKGKHVLIALLCFFGVVFTVNGIMMSIALTTMPGLDARNGYDVSQQFNRNEFARGAAQADKGWQSDASLALSGTMLNLSIAFRSREGRPITGVAVKVHLAHPASRRLDRLVSLTSLDNGIYVARVENIEPGAWGLSIEADDPVSSERLFLSRHRVVLKDARP